jgi:hypothetical protein
MFTWKRIAIVLLLFPAAFVAFQFTDGPKVLAQTIRPAMVRSVDEPARVPYFVSAQPTCPFTNECLVSGPVVPAGKRLRVTRLEGMLVLQATNIIVFLSTDDDNAPVVMFPSNTFGQAFFGTGVSFNQEVDFYFEAGQTPSLVVGTSGGNITTDARSRLTIAGYMVDVQP